MSKVIEKNKKKPRKKITEVAPRDYTVLGPSPDFVYFNPSEHRPIITGFVSRAEKWLMVLLLAMAAAAFLGFKLLQNSDLSFSVNDNSTDTKEAVIKAEDSVSSQAEFKANFLENRKDAREMLAANKTDKKVLRTANARRYIKTGHQKPQKKYAALTNNKSKKQALRKSFKKKTLAKR